MPWSTQHMNTFKGLQLCENYDQRFPMSVFSITLCRLSGGEKSALGCSCLPVFFKGSAPKYMIFGKSHHLWCHKGQWSLVQETTSIKSCLLPREQEAKNQLKQIQILQEAVKNGLSMLFTGDLYSCFLLMTFWGCYNSDIEANQHKHRRNRNKGCFRFLLWECPWSGPR